MATYNRYDWEITEEEWPLSDYDQDRVLLRIAMRIGRQRQFLNDIWEQPKQLSFSDINAKKEENEHDRR